MHIIANFHGTNLVICSDSREGKSPSYSQINTVLVSALSVAVPTYIVTVCKVFMIFFLEIFYYILEQLSFSSLQFHSVLSHNPAISFGHTKKFYTITPNLYPPFISFSAYKRR